MSNETYKQSITSLNTIRVTAGYPNYPGGGTHGGMDTVISNSLVYAPRGGTIITAHHWQGGTDPATADAWGNYILVQFASSKYWLAAHFANQIWGEGEEIRKGATGNVTGSHTHWEYWSGGQSIAYRLDPAIVLGIPSDVGVYQVIWDADSPPGENGSLPGWLLAAIKKKRRRGHV